MAEVKKIADHLQKEVKRNRNISKVALALGVVGIVRNVASISMQIEYNGISFAARN